MEGGGRFENNHFDREALYYEFLARRLETEVGQSPELQEEIVRFIEYIRLLQRFIPRELPYTERELRYQVLDREVERTSLPQLPITLPPPGRQLVVGEHMTVTVGQNAYACWPNEGEKELRLSDETIVTPETPIGKIDIVHDLPHLDSNTNLIAFARKLLKSSVGSLRELTVLCEQGDHRLDGIQVFAGISHLARIGGKLDFTVFDITDEGRQRDATATSLRVATYVSGQNKAWQEFKENYKPAKIAFISRRALQRKFGSSAVRNFK